MKPSCDVLNSRYDSRVKAMEVDERPTEQYSDIGGLDQQIQEVNFSVLQVNPNDIEWLPVTMDNQRKKLKFTRQEETA